MARETVLLTVRHGQTDFNLQRRYAGFIDVPLNDKGLQDARIASQSFDEKVDVVLTSPLRRCLDTAGLLVGDSSTPIVACELCAERDYGAMQGLTAEEVDELRPLITYFKVAGDFHSLNPPGGETFPALRKRVQQFVDYVEHEYAGNRVLVVSHEVFLLQLHGLLRGETWHDAMAHRLPNLRLTVLALRGDGSVRESARPLVATRQQDGRVFSHPGKDEEGQLPFEG